MARWSAQRRTARMLWLASVVLMTLAALAVLAGCTGSSATERVPVPTASVDAIQIVLDHAQYAPNQPVGVMVKNTSKTDYYALDARTQCTILQLQQYDQVNKLWVTLQGCTRVGPANAYVIPGGSSEPFTLAPGTRPTNPNAWDTGLYRVALPYGTQADGGGTTVTAYSVGFTVK